ncbi:MAG TPA: FG-GAP-like repeat-containing protein [Capsulimonadaceae bacterium]|jgi:hypothetical protein
MIPRSCVAKVFAFSVIQLALWVLYCPVLAARPVIFAAPYNLALPGVGEIQTGDIDADGHQDIAALTSTGFTVFYGAGDGSFGRVDYPGLGVSARVQIIDVNGDGLPDLVESDFNDSIIVVHVNLGDRKFAAGVHYAAGPNPAGVAAGDFNGDGKLDLVVACNGNRHFVILLNEGSGTFGAPYGYGGGSFPIDVAVADFNNDGKLDIAETSHYEDFSRVYHGDGAGSFAYAGDIPAGGGKILLGDVNGDGNMDVVGADYWSGAIDVVFGTASRTWPARVSYTGVQYPNTIAMGDLNGDGMPEIVSGNGGTSHFTVLVNAGDGTFADRQTVETSGNNSGPICMADFNEDGQLDVVSVSSTSNLTVYMNETYVPAITSISPSSVQVESGATVVTITGTYFSPSSSVAVNGVALVTTHVSATTLQATLPPDLLATAGYLNVAVTTPSPSTSSKSVTFTVTNPVPGIRDVSDDWVPVGSPDVSMMLTGPGYGTFSSVLLNGIQTTSVYRAGTLSFEIPATMMVSAGVIHISVYNPSPGGGTWGPYGFQVRNPTPTMTSVSPSDVPIGTGDTTVTIKGTNFVNGSIVEFGAFSFIPTHNSDGSLSILVSAEKLKLAAYYPVSVFNPGPGGGYDPNGTYPFRVNNPQPVLVLMAPTYGLAGTLSTPITLRGTGFISSSVIQLGGISLTTVLNAAGDLTATVPRRIAGMYTVTVTNPEIGGGVSNVFYFTMADSIHAFEPGLRMISFPYDYTGNMLWKIATNIAPIFAAWDPLGTKYLTWTADEYAPSKLGSACWSRFVYTSDLLVAGQSAPTSKPFEITLTKGWNQIGDPFLAKIPLQRIHVVRSAGNKTPLNWVAAVGSGLIGAAVYGYDTGSHAYAIATSLQPYEGYWVWCAADCTLSVPSQ